jgi:hypothetical protein
MKPQIFMPLLSNHACVWRPHLNGYSHWQVEDQDGHKDGASDEPTHHTLAPTHGQVGPQHLITECLCMGGVTHKLRSGSARVSRECKGVRSKEG